MSPSTSLAVVVAAVLFGGCATARGDRESMLRDVAEIAARHSPATIVPFGDDRIVAERVSELLDDGLTADEAVEIALLRNRNLRALYTDLDLASADLVQAGLLHNPVLDAAAGIPISGGIADLSFGLAVDVIDLLYVPLRRRVASARLDEAKLRLAADVLEFTREARIAFTEYQALEQTLELRRQIVTSVVAAADLAARMHEAGNVADLALSSEQALAEEAKLELRRDEIAAREARERVNALLGLWGPAVEEWKPATVRLPDPPEEELDVVGLESRAVERSLVLAAAERLVVAAGEMVGLDRAAAVFPEVVGGGEAARDDGEWTVGPSLTIPIPLFDWGQARVARARAELERARDLHHALAVQVRAATRSARDRVIGHRERAIHYRTVMLPLLERVLRETELQYNAMQIGPLDLLRAKERQIAAAAAYVEALRDYWAARADLGLILAGGLPPGEPGPTAPVLEQLPRFPFPAL